MKQAALEKRLKTMIILNGLTKKPKKRVDNVFK
jgi:hypothetical protein